MSCVIKQPSSSPDGITSLYTPRELTLLQTNSPSSRTYGFDSLRPCQLGFLKTSEESCILHYIDSSIRVSLGLSLEFCRHRDRTAYGACPCFPHTTAALSVE